jgi:hypothetical protein
LKFKISPTKDPFAATSEEAKVQVPGRGTTAKYLRHEGYMSRSLCGVFPCLLLVGQDSLGALAERFNWAFGAWPAAKMTAPSPYSVGGALLVLQARLVSMSLHGNWNSEANGHYHCWPGQTFWKQANMKTE